MSAKRNNQGVFKRLVNWLASFRRVDGVQLPPDGRSSAESIPGQFVQNAFGSVIPPFDLGVLKELEDLWKTNPDFSQHVKNIKSLANTGHTIAVDAASDTIAEAALTRINEAASRIYPNGAGVDALINQYLDQVSVYGAVSSEDVVNFAGRRVEQVALVPVRQIRFRYVNGRYAPYQQPLNLIGFKQGNPGALGLIELNPETYKYFPLQTVENSPYALPPALAAVAVMNGPQKDAFSNIGWLLNKLGLVGLVIAKLTKMKQKPSETQEEFEARAGKWLKAVTEKLDGNFRNGLLVSYDDIKFDHQNVASDARGATSIVQLVEELAFSGMGSMPFMHGRNYTTTETFADVIFNVIIAQMENIQRLAKRRMEATYRLDMLLGGIQVDAITLSFNEPKTRDNYRMAQAEQIRQTMIYERAKLGTISADDAAQELGYEAAFDPELISGPLPAVAAGDGGANFGAKRSGFSATFRFDRAAQRYRFVSSRIEVASGSGEAEEGISNFGLRIANFKKKEALAA